MGTGRGKQGAESEHLVDGKYTFKDLVDLEELEKILQRFSAATGFTTGLVSYPDQELLLGTGWRDICTKFHRPCPASEQACKESNQDLTARLRELRQLNVRHCENGLVDGATPIIIKGVHVASLATGQSLFEEPDLERFKEQARRFGYDEEAYLTALAEVPVVDEQRFKNALSFLSDLAVMIGELGLRNLALRQSTEELEEEVRRRRQVERELREHREQLEEQVESRTRDLKQTMGRLERSNHDLEQFARYVSHDLKEPLRAMAGFAQVLSRRYRGRLDAKADHFIERIMDGADRMGQMLSGLLDYSRVAAQDRSLEPTDCGEVLTLALENLDVALSEAGATVISSELPTVLAEPSQLSQVLQNLVGNAIKFNESGAPEVNLTANQAEDVWTISVRDNGIGIGPQYLEHIFHLFSRVDRDAFPGQGVGLAICQRVIERLGGRLWAESTPGEGSVFHFTLQAAKE